MGIDATVRSFRIIHVYLFLTTCLITGQAGAVVDISTNPNGTIHFEARDSSLDEIIKKIYNIYAIEVKGLEKREGEKITFSFFCDTPEELLKRLLRHIGIKNYAFEFNDATLKRLVVVPDAIRDTSSVAESVRKSSKTPELVNIAQVQSIVEGSQAETAGLQKGDIVLEYDGVRISSAQQLVNEVEKKADSNQVELLVVRQKIVTRLILSGGFIGVRIMTKKIPAAEFNAYHGTN